MHIVLGILVAVVGVIVLFNFLSRNAGEAVDNAKELARLPRRLKWQARQRKLSIRSLEDPQEAAVVLLLGIARQSGDVSSAQKQAIGRFAQTEFAVTEDEAHELILFAGFVLRDVFEFSGELRNVLEPISTNASDDARHRLVAAARSVAEADGSPPDSATAGLIDAVDSRLSKKPPVPSS